MKNLRKVCVAMLVCLLMVSNLAVVAAAPSRKLHPGKGNGIGLAKHRQEPIAFAQTLQLDEAEDEEVDDEEELPDEDVDDEDELEEDEAELDEVEEELTEAKQQLAAKQTIAAEFRLKAARFLADAEAKAAKNPKKAEHFLAHGQRKALEFEAKAQEMIAHGEAKVREWEHKAVELAVKAERETILDHLSQLIESAPAEEKPELKVLHRFFNKGLQELWDAELPEANAEQSLVLGPQQLADMLDAAVIIETETGETKLLFEKMTLTLVADKQVLVNGIAFTSEQLSVMPAELTSYASFLRDVMLATVVADAEGNLTISVQLEDGQVAEEPKEEPTEPGDTEDPEAPAEPEKPADDADPEAPVEPTEPSVDDEIVEPEEPEEPTEDLV